MNTKKQIIHELTRSDFPNLKFLFSDDVLTISLELLGEFLSEEKQKFEELIKTKNENINFEIFDEESNLSFFWGLLNHLSNVNDNDKIRKIIEDFEVELVDFSNEQAYNKRYFEMLEYCFLNCDLDIEQTKIINDAIKSYKIRGINLEEKKQNELKEINKKLNEITTKFSNNVLDSKKEFEYFLESDEFLKEFPESDLGNAKNLYIEKMKKKDSTEGFSPLGYAFDSSSSSYVSIMKYCSSSEIRKYFEEAFGNFASNGKFDNREIVLQIINLENKKAKLLGYNNFAELSLEFKMAESPKQVLELLEDLSKKAKPKALAEIEEIKNYFDLEELNSWDIGYYSRILKKEKYNLDDKKLKEFFEFENTKTALFDTVKKLYNIEMKKIPLSNSLLKEKEQEHKKSPSPSGEGWGEDIEIYEVYKDSKFISYFMGDYFYNENKRGGAWADELRERFGDKKSIVVNVMNFVKSESGKTLLTLGEVETMFHEFGHGIHSMLSKSKHSDLSGFGVEWDFVELPSQILEKWASENETIINVAKHHETGEDISSDLLKSLNELKYFGTGSQVIGQNMYSIIDMMFYSGEIFENVDDLDKKFLEKVNSLSIFEKGENYKMYTSFSHIFAGGYSAGYYSYMWADIIVDEIWKQFKKKGVYNKEFANQFEQKILGAGSLKKASEMFEDLMGRGVEIDAFLSEKGLK